MFRKELFTPGVWDTGGKKSLEIGVGPGEAIRLLCL